MPTRPCQEALNIANELAELAKLIDAADRDALERPMRARDELQSARIKLRHIHEATVRLAEQL